MTTPKALAADMAVDCYCFRARRASRLLTRAYDEALRPLGVQTSQLGVLVVVAQALTDGAPLALVADVLGMDRTTLSRNVRPLEKAGLIRIARSPRDARVRLLRLTAAGEDVVIAAHPLWRRAQRDVAERLGEDAAAQLLGSLDAVGAAMGGAIPFPLPGEARSRPTESHPQ